jgi:hypothetical protein
MTDDRISKSLYEQDLDAWAIAQAAAPRAGAGAGYGLTEILGSWLPEPPPP